jgi:cytochrome c553
MKLVALFLPLVLLAGAAHAQGNIAAGEKKSVPCQACHGADGNSTSPDFPRLAGQYPDYMVQALMDYKAGARKNPIMAPFAAQLSPKDMEDVAAYYASRPNGLVMVPLGP